MSDAAAPKQVKKATKPRVPAAHPKYSEMTITAVQALKDRKGSSRQAILKYIQANNKVGDNAGSMLKNALKKLVAKGELKQMKGTGASGSFKVGELPKPKKVVKKKPAKKPAAKKPKAKKPAAKKAAAKPKKAAKSPKKAAKPKKTAKSPAKKAAKKAAKPAKKAAKPAKKAAKAKKPAKK